MWGVEISVRLLRFELSKELIKDVPAELLHRDLLPPVPSSQSARRGNRGKGVALRLISRPNDRGIASMIDCDLHDSQAELLCKAFTIMTRELRAGSQLPPTP